MNGLWLAYDRHMGNLVIFEEAVTALEYAQKQPQIMLRYVDTFIRSKTEVTTPLSVLEATAIYEAGIEKASDAQKRMIYALISREHGYTSDADIKAILTGIVAEEHAGYVLGSIKELSKVWASDVISYLKSHTSGDLNKFTLDAVPF